MDENTNTVNTNPAPANNNGMIFALVGIVLLAVIGYMAFANNEQPATTETEDTQTQMIEEETVPVEVEEEVVEENEDITMEQVEVKEFQLEAGAYYFRPNEIRVKKGDTVRVTLSAVDMMHDFNIDELGVKLPVTQSGETNMVEFVASEAGTFEFYCSVNQHRAQGQVGTLVVEE